LLQGGVILVAGFLGQIAMKTHEVINSAKGGVLLIDEVYSLGNEEKGFICQGM
jgi:hypothetical protein